MNSFGDKFKVEIFGESHGVKVGIIIDGCPAGLNLSVEDLMIDISRRKSGSKGTTPRVEADLPQIISGVYEGKTTGSPIAILFDNNNVNSGDYGFITDFPRPGHADLVAKMKFHEYNDPRGGGHFSGRLTLPIVAAGVVAKKIIDPVSIEANIVTIGGNKDFEKAISEAINQRDSVGALIECVCKGIPIGWGEPFFDSLESKISHIVFAIPAVKGIEFGSGFKSAEMYGSQVNDIYLDENGHTLTNNSGGINGGISNGNDIVFRIAIKPASSISKPQYTFNFAKKEMDQLALHGRHDACIGLRVPPVLEAATAIALADLKLSNYS